MLSWHSFVCSLPHWSFLTHRDTTCTIVYYWQMSYLDCHAEVLKLKFRSNSFKMTAAADFLGSVALSYSSTMLYSYTYINVPTLSQQNHFDVATHWGRGSLFSQTLCVYPVIPQKKFTSTRKVLRDLDTSQTCSVFHSRFPQGGLANSWECLSKGFCLCGL